MGARLLANIGWLPIPLYPILGSYDTIPIDPLQHESLAHLLTQLELQYFGTPHSVDMT